MKRRSLTTPIKENNPLIKRVASFYFTYKVMKGGKHEGVQIIYHSLLGIGDRPFLGSRPEPRGITGHGTVTTHQRHG
jgi:hypothetical protein